MFPNKSRAYDFLFSPSAPQQVLHNRQSAAVVQTWPFTSCFFLSFFFVIHGCQGTLIKISIFLLVRIFFFFISFISSVLNILLLGRSQIILLIISRLLLLNHCRFSKDGEVFFSRKEDSNGQLFCPSTRACFWLAIEEQNVSFILKYQETWCMGHWAHLLGEH